MCAMKTHGLTDRIAFRCSREFSRSVRSAAKRAEVDVADYLRLALADKMALDKVREAVMENDND